jgi:regulator of cell morphogenesis and NO signaling
VHKAWPKGIDPAREERNMNLTAEKTVRELAIEKPGAVRVFEMLGIDYCCGGKVSLEQACSTASLSVGEVLASLEAAERSAQKINTDRDWHTEPLVDLISHITGTHHQYTREEIGRLGPLFQKVCSVHGKNHPELLPLQRTFAGLAEELTSHMMKEEMILFPQIKGMEEAGNRNAKFPPSPFGTVKNPVAMMEREHDAAGQALRALREASHGYAAPPDACVSFQTLYKALAEFEADLHQHIHLENNILFPRAIALESARG